MVGEGVSLFMISLYSHEMYSILGIGRVIYCFQQIEIFLEKKRYWGAWFPGFSL